MTIYTHGFFGLGMARLVARRKMPLLFWALALALPISPDFDSFSAAGYGDMLGHRGWTHSLTFAGGLGLAAALTFKYFKFKLWQLAIFFGFIVASHGVMDALTRGGFGIPFFWPFSSARYGGWGPVKVADIGFEFPDPRRSQSIRDELLWVWLPTTVIIAAVMSWRWYHRATRGNENHPE
jgi:inner membrane protein